MVSANMHSGPEPFVPDKTILIVISNSDYSETRDIEGVKPFQDIDCAKTDANLAQSCLG